MACDGANSILPAKPKSLPSMKVLLQVALVSSMGAHSLAASVTHSLTLSIVIASHTIIHRQIHVIPRATLYETRFIASTRPTTVRLIKLEHPTALSDGHKSGYRLDTRVEPEGRARPTNVAANVPKSPTSRPLQPCNIIQLHIVDSAWFTFYILTSAPPPLSKLTPILHAPQFS